MWSHQHIAYLKSLRMVEVGSFLLLAHLAPQPAPAVPASYLGTSMEQSSPTRHSELEAQRLWCPFSRVIEGWGSWRASANPRLFHLRLFTDSRSPWLLEKIKTALPVLSRVYSRCSPSTPSRTPTQPKVHGHLNHKNTHTHTLSLRQKWPKLCEVHMSLEMISFACFKSALVCTACSSKFTLQKADSFFHIVFT